MGASKFLASCLLGLVAGIVLAQDQNPSAFQALGQSPSQATPRSEKEPSSDQSVPAKEGSGSHRSAHHIEVPVEGSQPPELTQAEALIEKKDYVASDALLRKFLIREPASYVGWFDLGFVENGLGKVADSIAAYRKSVAAKPDIFESNLNLGLQLAKTGQPDAEDFLRAATRLKPTSHTPEGQYRAWLSLGQTIEKAKPDEALSAYLQAAKLQSQEVEPHLLAGHLLEQENKFADAEREYKLALEMDSRSADAAIGLANIYMRGHRFPEAEDYLRKLLAEHADSGPVHIQLGRVLAAEGKNDAAILELQDGIKQTPVDEAAQRDLAELDTTTGRYDLAETAYRALLLSHPNDAQLHRSLGQAMLRQKKFPEALREFTNAVRLAPAMGEGYGDLAFAASETKDFSLVIRALDARSKLLLPESPVTYFLRASAYDHLHDPKKAAANYHLFLNTASGKYPDYEWQAKHRLIAIEPKK